LDELLKLADFVVCSARFPQVIWGVTCIFAWFGLQKFGFSSMFIVRLVRKCLSSQLPVTERHFFSTFNTSCHLQNFSTPNKKFLQFWKFIIHLLFNSCILSW
jgi:hypothetical protein